MSFINLDQLPFVGMSHEFVGEVQGAPFFSAYIVSAEPGRGPRLHTTPMSKWPLPSKAAPLSPLETKSARSQREELL